MRCSPSWRTWMAACTLCRYIAVFVQKWPMLFLFLKGIQQS